MPHPSHWLDILWRWAVPALGLLGALWQARQYRMAGQLGLLGRSGLRWLLLGLALSQVFILFLLAANGRDTALWPSAGSLAAAAGMAWASRQATRQVHPGLRGFLRPIPRDALEKIDWESAPGRDRRVARWLLLRLLPFLPAAATGAYVLVNQAFPSPAMWAAAPALLCPALIIPFRRLWAASLLLLPMALAMGGQAYALRSHLPAGDWTRPITKVRCTSQIQLSLDGKAAWCADSLSERVFRLDPYTGRVSLEVEVASVYDVLAADGARAWVYQNPAQGLVLVEAGQQTAVALNFAYQGAAQADGSLYAIDHSGALLRARPGEDARRVTLVEGLLNNTANVVRVAPDGTTWVGSVGGASYSPAGSARWQVIPRGEYLPGPVRDISFGPGGSVWMLWSYLAASGNTVVWGVSSRLCGTEMPCDPASTAGGDEGQPGSWTVTTFRGFTPFRKLVRKPEPGGFYVDDRNTAWLILLDYAKREAVLAIFQLSEGGSVTSRSSSLRGVYSLGAFAPPGFAGLAGAYGLVPDGRGGVLLYVGETGPLRHWEP